MNKPFLLIAGDNNMYPASGAGDWINCFSTYEEAEAHVRERKIKGLYGVKIVYDIDNVGRTKCDWYEIVDLREWTE